VGTADRELSLRLASPRVVKSALVRDITLPSGESMTVLGSTRKLDSVAFSEYVSKVKRWAMEQGLEIPDQETVGDL